MPVFDSRPCFFMDKNRGLVLGVVAVLVVGAGSASVLDSFGSISGTADVEPAVELVEVRSSTTIDGNAGEYLLFRNNLESLDTSNWKVRQSSDDMQLFSEATSSVSSEYFAIADSSATFSGYSDVVVYEVESVTDAGIPSSSADSTILDLVYSSTVIQEVDYGSCAAEKAWNVSDRNCEDPTIEVSNK